MKLYMVILAYLIIMNFVTFLVFAIDKRKAIKHKYRIPEKSLFAWAIAGGSIGALLGMYVCRHKTRVWYFVVGIPVILVLQIAVAGYLLISFK